MSDNHKHTDFGYQQVPHAEKNKLVANVFSSVASKYDLMNNLMSFGLHHWWKQVMIQEASVRPGYYVLDIASGSGDLAQAFAKSIRQQGQLFVTDINPAMLQIAQDRMLDKGLIKNVSFIIANAEQLPFPCDYFDIITIAFGLRNVTNKDQALREMYRVVKPGGKVLILEFSHPENKFIQRLYDFYSFNIIPNLGKWVAHDKSSYQYLVESIRMHPNQETLKRTLTEANFEDVTYHNFHSGIVALHKGYKY